MPDETIAGCNPNGVNPCCNENLRCGNTTEDCACDNCTDYRKIDRDWEESGGEMRWRYDGRCGGFTLPNGDLADCDPHGDGPCCNLNYGNCGSSPEYCSCDLCTDNERIYREWQESGGEQRWRSDEFCGSMFPLPDGTPAECDPEGEKPCCSYSRCGNQADICQCHDCIDYRVLREVRKSGENCTVARIGDFLQNVCFDEQMRTLYKCLYSDVYYVRHVKFHHGLQGVSEVCKNDPYFYQACDYTHQIFNTDVLCSGYICGEKQDGQYKYIKCEGEDCSADKRESCETEEEYSTEIWCDNKCDVDYVFEYCVDESNCNGYKYGLNCTCRGMQCYRNPHMICDGKIGYFECDNNEDERNCDVTEDTAYTCTHFDTYQREKVYKTVPILNYTRCATIGILSEDYFAAYPYCLNYLDQTNCSDIDRVGGYCDINGYFSNVSISMVCHKDRDNITAIDINLCDDDLQKACFSLPGSSCRQHKHKTCDRKFDCPDKSDEFHDACESMSNKLNFTCQRRFNFKHGASEIPVDWIMDNVTDCFYGEDEISDRWQICRGESGKVLQVLLPGEKCKDVYKCPRGDKSYVMFTDLCDGLESCGDEAENEVCRVARDFPSISFDTIANDGNGSDRNVCNMASATCKVEKFVVPWGDVFGTSIKVNTPTTKVTCSDRFGEHYLFLSCMDQCEENATCPLKGPNRILAHDSCPGQFPERIFTLANETFLTFVVKSEDGYFHQDFFRCDNQRCVNFSQVCDLKDDCGDMSDELNCTNHMICEHTSNSTKPHLVSLSQKCDGIYDCFDLSDECNDLCGKEILGSLALKIICWIMGILAIILNTLTVQRELILLRTLRKSASSPLVMNNKVLVILIGLGDLCIGTYLILLSIYDSIIFGKGFCKHQAEWLTGALCTVLGVISTFGSQVSLFSMTVLSFIRMVSMFQRSMTLPSHVNFKRDLFTGFSVLGIMMAALAVATVPLFPSLEDYFVQGMYYDPSYKVFIGFPNKIKHVKILNSYYNSSENSGRNMTEISWKQIGEMVDGMFSQRYGMLPRRPVHFYGNDGVCLFKYFVRTDDARRVRQGNEMAEADITNKNGDAVVWTMLAVNLFCFISMTICYIILVLSRRQSSQKTGQKNGKNEELQRRVTIILITDFLCWVPFILISSLHDMGEIDATTWYEHFAMIVLPLNSVLNPLIYHDSIRGFLYKKASSVAETSMKSLSYVISQFQQGSDPGNADLSDPVQVDISELKEETNL